MPARLSAFVIWALVAASAAFWGLRLFVRAPGAPAHTLSVGDAAPVRADLTRLLGAPPVAALASVQAPATSSRFQLAGVMAPKVAGHDGIALIAVDGKMARPYRVGATIDGDLVLQSVSLRSASIGPVRGTPAVVLELPPLPPPAIGSLPPATMVPLTAAPAPAMVPTPNVARQAPPARLAPQQRSRGIAPPPQEENQNQGPQQTLTQ